jgi:hypothetical protein
MRCRLKRDAGVHDTQAKVVIAVRKELEAVLAGKLCEQPRRLPGFLSLRLWCLGVGHTLPRQCMVLAANAVETMGDTFRSLELTASPCSLDTPCLAQPGCG